MYYVFACDTYFPSGGGNDFQGFSHDRDEAIAIAREALIERGFDWAEIFITHPENGLVLDWSSL